MTRRCFSLSACACPVFVLASACGVQDGEGMVTVRFFDGQCGLESSRRIDELRFDATFLATSRFGNILNVEVLHYGVNLEETDGLIMRIDLTALLDNGSLVRDKGRGFILRSRPQERLVLATTREPGDVNATLSLFESCPEWPQQNAASGMLSLSKFSVAIDPEDTGTGERIAGTLTATLARAHTPVPVGTLDASFDFIPPRRPLADLK